MRTTLKAIYDYKNDDYAQLIELRIINLTIAMLNQGQKEANRTSFNFETGKIENITDKIENVIKFYAIELEGYRRDNYPEFFK